MGSNELEGRAGISEGSPEQLVVRREGMSRTFLTTRMKVLNTNFSRAVAEIFVADDELAKLMEEYKIRITQVRVTPNLRGLHIFWVTKHSDVKKAFEHLNANKGKLHELLIEMQYTNSVPWIVFIYDLHEANEDEIALRLEQCKGDLTESEERRQQELLARFESNSTDESENIKTNISDQISFEDPFKEVPVDEYTQRMQKLNPTDYYRNLRLKMPPDMPQDTLGLDYEELMNRVLSTMHRARAQHQFRVTSESELNAVGDHLPPLDMKAVLEKYNSNSNNSAFEYNTEERIKAIKKFVELNRRRRNKLELKAKRRLLEEEINRLDSYEALRERLQESMSELHPDIIPSAEEESEESSSDDQFTTIK